MNSQELQTLQQCYRLLIGDHLQEAGHLLKQLKAQSAHPDVMQAHAILAMKQGQAEQAIHLLQAALKAHPEHVGCQTNLAFFLLDCKRIQEALPWLERLSQAHPHDLNLALRLADGLSALGRYSQARTVYQRIFALDATSFAVRVNYANCLRALGDADSALRLLQPLQTASIDHPLLWLSLAGVHLDRQDWPMLNESLKKLSQFQDFALHRVLLTMQALRYQMQYDDLISYGIKFLEQNRHPQVLHELGLAYQLQGRLDLAESTYVQALSLNSNLPDTLNNLGSLYEAQGQWSWAEQKYAQAHQLDATRALFEINLSLMHLVQGHWQEGWLHYRARPSRMHCPFLSELAWVSQIKLAPNTDLYIYPEQGLGDELFFLRFARVLADAGIRIHYQATRKLQPLLENLDWLQLHAVPASRERICLLLGDLPLLVPEQHPPSLRLQPNAAAVQTLSIYSDLPQELPWLGLTWRAGTQQEVHEAMRMKASQRCLDLQLWLEHFAAWPGLVFVLQRFPQPEELELLRSHFGPRLVDASAWNENLSQMLALLQRLDEYVTVCNTNVHLRACLDLPSHVFVPHPPEFRWMHEGETSPWFPRSWAYRPSPAGDWHPALTRCRDRLAQKYAWAS